MFGKSVFVSQVVTPLNEILNEAKITVYLWNEHGVKQCQRHKQNMRRQMSVVRKYGLSDVNETN